jgi:hypothetical protein
MTTIPQDAFKEILEELQERPIPVNKYRDTAGTGRSQTFGLVNKRCQPVDWSRQCWIRPKLFYHLQEFAKTYVDISWTSITVNQNYRSLPHRDKGNYGDSFLVAFGSFSGGDLVIHEGDLSGTHNIWCKPIKTDFSKVLHSVEHFTGERYSLVFYNLKTTRMPTEPLPKGEAVFENGKYVFKRGGKIITPKEGLSHPLRGRKKEVMTTDTSQSDFIVSFD